MGKRHKYNVRFNNRTGCVIVCKKNNNNTFKGDIYRNGTLQYTYTTPTTVKEFEITNSPYSSPYNSPRNLTKSMLTEEYPIINNDDSFRNVKITTEVKDDKTQVTITFDFYDNLSTDDGVSCKNWSLLPNLVSIDQWTRAPLSRGGNQFVYYDGGFTYAPYFTMPSDNPLILSDTSLFQMFLGASAFNEDIGSWNVSGVTNMLGMFYDANAFNQDIGSWNVSGVKSMGYMFYDATAFDQDIGSWNVGGVTNMNSMFRTAEAFNQNIGSWNVGGVTNMGYMFYDATAFDQDIGSWNVGGVTNMVGMFYLLYSIKRDHGMYWCYKYDCYV